MAEVAAKCPVARGDEYSQDTQLATVLRIFQYADFLDVFIMTGLR
jgi:hypothetical protein